MRRLELDDLEGGRWGKGGGGVGGVGVYSTFKASG